MNKKTIVFIGCMMFILSILTACSSQDAQEDTAEEESEDAMESLPPEVISEPKEEQPSQETAPETEVVEEVLPAPETYTLTKEEQEKAADRLSEITQAVLSRTIITNMNAGDSAVIALGVRNTENIEHDFDISVTFKQANTPSMGVIDQAEAASINKWVSMNNYETFHLDRSEAQYFPLIVKVGDEINEDGDPVAPGTYLFDVIVTYKEQSLDRVFDIEHAVLTLTVQVPK